MAGDGPARAEKAKTDAKPLRVSAPLVHVKFTNGTVGQMLRGDVITENVSKESVEFLTELGFLTDEEI